MTPSIKHIPLRDRIFWSFMLLDSQFFTLLVFCVNLLIKIFEMKLKKISCLFKVKNALLKNHIFRIRTVLVDMLDIEIYVSISISCWYPVLTFNMIYVLLFKDFWFFFYFLLQSGIFSKISICSWFTVYIINANLIFLYVVHKHSSTSL